MDLITGAGFGLSAADVQCVEPGEGLAVFLSDVVNDSKATPPQWIVEVHATTSRGHALVGRVVTTPATINVEPRARMVALATVPGAQKWIVRFRGPKGQKAYVDLATGCGVGSGLPGVVATRPRPRAFARAGSSVAAAFDAVLMGFHVADASDPAVPIPAGSFFLAFNKSTPPAAGDVPIVTRPIASGGAFDLLFDGGTESGDSRFTSGISWGLSSTPGAFTPIAGSQLAVVTVIG